MKAGAIDPVEPHLLTIEQDRKLGTGQQDGFNAISSLENTGEIAQKPHLFAPAASSANNVKIGIMNKLTLTRIRFDDRSVSQPAEQFRVHHWPGSEQRHPRIMETS